MKFLNFDRVLCLAPHPDDSEYSIAGIVLKYQDTIFDLVCLSAGSKYDSTSSKDRYTEVENAWKITNAKNYNLYFSDYLHLKDRELELWIRELETEFINKQQYDCILVSSEQDSHHEHIFVSSLAAPLSRIKPFSIIQYRSPSTLDTWMPNLFVSIDDVYETKKLMLKEFKSQANKTYLEDRVLDGFHTVFQSMKKGKGFVESFKIVICYE